MQLVSLILLQWRALSNVSTSCLHTKLYKGAWNVSANNSETVGHKDLRRGQIVYILVFYNIHFLGFFHWTVSNLFLVAWQWKRSIKKVNNKSEKAPYASVCHANHSWEQEPAESLLLGITCMERIFVTWDQALFYQFSYILSYLVVVRRNVMYKAKRKWSLVSGYEFCGSLTLFFFTDWVLT